MVALVASVTQLILKRAALSRSSGQWSDDDYDVLENGVVVGRISKEQVAPKDRLWMWASGHNGEIRRAAHGYEPTREAAMAAFARSWRRVPVQRGCIFLLAIAEEFLRLHEPKCCQSDDRKRCNDQKRHSPCRMRHAST
jgi:hypothetical protein